MLRSFALALATAAAVFLPHEACAIRPFVTDDARVVGDRLAQLETWVLGNRHETVHFALGAVGPTDWLEVTTGVFQGDSYEGPDRGYSITGPLFQLKALAHEAKPGAGPGVAFAAGVLPPFGHGSLTPEGTGMFGYMALTQSLFNDDLLLHANIGVVTADEKNHWTSAAIAGFGFQAHVIDRLYAVAEVNRGDPYEPLLRDVTSQVGFRYILNDKIQFDGTLGSTVSGNSEQWWTLGVRIVSDTLW